MTNPPEEDPMTVQIVRFTAEPTDVPDVEAAIEAMVAAIHRERPAGTRFTSWKLADGVTFLNVLELAEGVENPMPGIAECRAYQQMLAHWVAEPPSPQPVSVVGTYA
jgi:hypothetical protein